VAHGQAGRAPWRGLAEEHSREIPRSGKIGVNNGLPGLLLGRRLTNNCRIAAVEPADSGLRADVPDIRRGPRPEPLACHEALKKWCLEP
jgi:hypothetical protein